MNAQPLRSRNPWRIARWAVAALLLLWPAVAMQFTDEVRWGPGDFVVAAALLGGVCGTFDLLERLRPDRRTRWLTGGAVVLLCAVVWAELAVGLFH